MMVLEDYYISDKLSALSNSFGPLGKNELDLLKRMRNNIQIMIEIWDLPEEYLLSKIYL